MIFFFFLFRVGITPFQGDSFQEYKLIRLAHNIWKVPDVYSTQIQSVTGSAPLGWQRHAYTIKYFIMLEEDFVNVVKYKDICYYGE